LNGELFITLFWVITSNEFKPGGLKLTVYVIITLPGTFTIQLYVYSLRRLVKRLHTLFLSKHSCQETTSTEKDENDKLSRSPPPWMRTAKTQDNYARDRCWTKQLAQIHDTVQSHECRVQAGRGSGNTEEVQQEFNNATETVVTLG
jgi:hypothetical protein